MNEVLQTFDDVPIVEILVVTSAIRFATVTSARAAILRAAILRAAIFGISAFTWLVTIVAGIVGAAGGLWMFLPTRRQHPSRHPSRLRMGSPHLRLPRHHLSCRHRLSFRQARPLHTILGFRRTVPLCLLLTVLGLLFARAFFTGVFVASIFLVGVFLGCVFLGCVFLGCVVRIRFVRIVVGRFALVVFVFGVIGFVIVGFVIVGFVIVGFCRWDFVGRWGFASSPCPGSALSRSHLSWYRHFQVASHARRLALARLRR